MTSRDIVISNPVRTAIGAFGGTLKDVPATDLGGLVVREAVRRSGIDASKLGSIVMGNVVQAGNRMNPARQAAIAGGVPVSVPSQTVNRVCGSGAQAVVSAAQEIWLGFGDVAVAGGMENMDRAPYLLDKGRWGYRMGNAQIYDSALYDGLLDAFSGEHSGWHTEDLVTKLSITRSKRNSWQLKCRAVRKRSALSTTNNCAPIPPSKRWRSCVPPFAATARLRPAIHRA